MKELFLALAGSPSGPGSAGLGRGPAAACLLLRDDSEFRFHGVAQVSDVDSSALSELFLFMVS